MADTFPTVAEARANWPEAIRSIGEQMVQVTDGDNERTVFLNLSPYESTVLVGALRTFAVERGTAKLFFRETHDGDEATAYALAERVTDQLPDAEQWAGAE